MENFITEKKLPDLSFLTEYEKNTILDVINRDEIIRKKRIEICL
jgi:hypothetical protein